jgi:hypothetical protein
LDGDDVKPADDLRQQAVVLRIVALLHTEVGDVPGRQQQLARDALRDPSLPGMRPQRPTLFGYIDRKLGIPWGA